MSATQDESQDLDAGWDDEPSTESAVSAEPEPSAEEVDGGWDDAAGTEPGAKPLTEGQGRHRKRRAKADAIPLSSNPVLLPRPAEPSKKQQREHARQQRAHEAQVKQQRKVERKAERAAQAREEATARVRQAEAEAQARRKREEARERARGERSAERPAVAKPKRPKPDSATLKRPPASESLERRKSGLRPGVIITLVALVLLALLLLLRK